MSTKLYIFPLGFHEDFILRRLSRTDANRYDHILVITCQPLGAGTRRAYGSLHAKTIDLGFGEPELIVLDCSDPAESMNALWNAVGNKVYDEIIVDISGGMRILSIIAILTLLIKRIPFTLYYQPESGAFEETIIPKEIIQLIIQPLTSIEKHLLEIISGKGAATVKELSNTMGRKEKTIMNIIARLRNKKLIVKKTRKHIVQPTKWAKIATD